MEEKKTLKVRAKEGWTKVKKEAADTGKLFWRGCKAVVPIISGCGTLVLFVKLLSIGLKDDTSTDTGSDEIYDDEELKELVESEELSEEEA